MTKKKSPDSTSTEHTPTLSLPESSLGRSATQVTDLSFWDHLEELRGVLLRCLVATVAATLIVFCFKDETFAIVFAPKQSSIFSSLFSPTTPVQIINTELTQQFIVHMMVSFYFALLITAPYIIYQIYGFILPALKREERRYSTPLIISSYIMFMLGVCFNYFILFPLTFRFLASYQVDTSVSNLISLESYIDTLMFLSLAMGITFQLPIISWFLGVLRILNKQRMKMYRRHAFVATVVVAAVITPTTDAFTLTLVSLPMYALYEISILLVKKQ